MKSRLSSSVTRKLAGKTSSQGMLSMASVPSADQRAERGLRLLHAEAEIGEEALGDDDLGNGQRRIDHHRADEVGNDVPEDDLERPLPGSACGLDEFALLDRQRLAAHDARHGQPFERADRDEEQIDVAAEDHHQDDDEQDVGQRIHDVDEAHHDRIEPAAEIAGDRAVEHADDDRDDGRRQRDGKRHLRAVEHAGQQVAAVLVGAEIVARSRSRAACGWRPSRSS